MAIQTQNNGTLRDKDDKSFVESPSRGDVYSAREVVVGNTPNVAVVSDLLGGVTFDAITFSYPDRKTEVFTYFTGGLNGSIVAVVTAIYYDIAKKKLKSVSRQ